MTSTYRYRALLVVFAAAGVAAMALLGVVAGSSGAAAGDTTRVSVADSGTEGNGDSRVSLDSSISADGRYMVFSSFADNLVPGDTNRTQDVFVRDLKPDSGQTQTIRRVSVADSGTQANDQSSAASISDDGRYVAFTSFASNLVPGDTNSAFDVFVVDLKPDSGQTQTIRRVSVDDSGTQANDGSFASSISADGRYIAFASLASNLVPGDTNGQIDRFAGRDIFVRDLQEEKTQRVSVADSGTQADKESFNPFISTDGRYVAFESDAKNLVGDDTNNLRDVFVRDRDTDDDGVLDEEGYVSTERVSVTDSGTQVVDGRSFVSSISEDGHHVLFNSSSNLVEGDTNSTFFDDVFVRDLQTGSTKLVSVSSCGTQANSSNRGGDISPDGRFVTFSSFANNLVANDNNHATDIFVRDLQTGTTQRVSVDSSGIEANNSSSSFASSISADGRYVSFDSLANNLVANDNNSRNDVFVHERNTAQPIDCSAPTTTASAITSSGDPYEPGEWTNEDVKVTFSAEDEGGSGVKDIRYSASGAQSIGETVYDSQKPPVINVEGSTTIDYYATDEAGNVEEKKSLTINIDRTPPQVDESTLVPQKNATGVSTTTQIKASFLPDSIVVPNNNSWFTVVSQRTGKEVAGTPSYDPESNTATFTLDPGTTLNNGDAYKVTIKKEVSDKAGNAMAQDYTWLFTTAGPRRQK